jgi:hypothetical protein
MQKPTIRVFLELADRQTAGCGGSTAGARRSGVWSMQASQGEHTMSRALGGCGHGAASPFAGLACVCTLLRLAAMPAAVML